MTAAPLDGIRVVDFSELLPGPFLSQSLVELGASVTKIERPPHGDGTRRLAPGVFEAVNRGKASICADLKDPGTRERVRTLALTADVVIDGFRPGVMARLGLGYASLSIDAPRLIFASLTGYGQTGPLAQRPGHDVNYLAAAGAIALSGSPAGDPAHAFGLPAADLCAATYALSAILAALYQRQQSGNGQHLDIAMADCVAHWLNPRLGAFAHEGFGSLAAQRADTLVKPGYGVFRCRDGLMLSIGALEDHFWARLSSVLDVRPFVGPAYAAFRARSFEAAAINAALAAAVAGHTASDAERILLAVDVPAMRVLAPFEVSGHEQFVARDLFPATATGQFARFPIRLNGMRTPGATPLLDADKALLK
jgi:crotonobetainyl-CoA:carnitine CoA-transferase CaiB-like acyl-CoA transferase